MLPWCSRRKGRRGTREVQREDLRPYLEQEVETWSAKSYETLRKELEEGPYNRCDPGAEYHIEVDLVENRDDYVHVSVGVCSGKARWSCFHPLCSSFLVYRDGRVDK